MNTTAEADELMDSIAWTARESGRMAGVPKLPPSREPKKQRNIKVEDPLWDKAVAKSAAQGKNMSEYIRMLIDRDTMDE